MLVEPIALRARHHELVHGGVDMRSHVVVMLTASIYDLVAR